MSLKQALLVSSLVLGTLLLIANVVIWNSGARLRTSEQEAARIEHGMLAFKNARFHVVQIQQFLTDSAAVGEADFGHARAERQAAREELANVAKAMPEYGAEITPLYQDIDQLSQVGERMASAYIEQGREAGNAMMKGEGGFDAITEIISRKLESLSRRLHGSEEKVETDLHDTVRYMVNVSLAVSGLALLFILVANGWLYRVLICLLGAEPSTAGSIASRIAGGDLADEGTAARPPEDSLLGTIRRMRGSLRDTVAAIRSSADTVLGSSQRLHDEAANVVGASREQSDAAASMSAAVEQMAASIALVADNARHVSQRAKEAGDEAESGGREVNAVAEVVRDVAGSVDQASQVIRKLGEESRRITQIVDTIREIAEQTNLLALNAAIEAARAGEQGRGFAVVADEVRKLAERTTSSTQEIGAMVEAINQRVDEAMTRMTTSLEHVAQGVAQSDKAYSAIGRLRQGAEGMIGEVHEIDRALQEQRSASDSIAQSVERIAHMAESNQAAIARIAGDAKQLEDLSENLDALVKGFRV
jgi:methyl-accepting chemotaxis protein